MKHITNLREARQMQCQGAELCEVVSICVGDLERIAEVAEANLRDKFAMASINACLIHENPPEAAVVAYEMADEMLKARNVSK